jgi:hypothetical protein
LVAPLHPAPWRTARAQGHEQPPRPRVQFTAAQKQFDAKNYEAALEPSFPQQ